MAVIRDLKTDFTGIGQVKGFKFTQISKTNSAYVYEVNSGDMIYYEVFRKVINRRFACVSYPSAQSFGIWAWTTPNIIVAFEILNDLSNNDSIIEADTDVNLSNKKKS